jgi:hypothetical protein
MLKFLAFLLAILLAIPITSSAKRVPPQPVSPLVHNNVKYSAEGDGRTGYVVATDDSNGKVMWRAKIFHVHLKPFLEEDVQWVFISDLKLSGNALLVRDEKSRCYRVDLSTKRVQRSSCP